MADGREDSELLAAWREGDARAGRRLVERYLSAIGRFFSNKVAETHEAEDLTADTFARLSDSLRRFRGESSVRTFLFAIAHNVFREYVRRQQRDAARQRPLETMADLGPSPSVMFAKHDEQRLLLHALRALPYDLQVILELSFFEEMPRSEIARVVGEPAGTVAGRLTKARARLGEELARLSRSRELLESTTTDLEGWARALRDSLFPE